VLQALAVGGRLPNGLTFANPPLFKYVLLTAYAADYAVQQILGLSASPQDFIAHFRADPSQLYLIARVTSAVIGSATAVAGYALGAAVGGRRVGLIAAWLTAVAYLLVRDSHFGVDDALVTLLVTIGLVLCIRIAHGGTRRDYAAGGALAGLAFAAKYDGIALLAPFVLAHVLRGANRRQGDLMLGLTACLAAGLIAFPSLLTETSRVLQDIYLHLYLGATGGYDGLDPAGGYISYGKSLVTGFGWPLVVAVLVGLVLSVRRRDRSLMVVAALPLSMIAVLGAQQMYFARFLLPTLPALLVAAAAALDSLMAIQALVGFLAAMVVALPTLVDAVRFDVLLTHEDTRQQAAGWIATQLPTGTVVAVDAPPLGPPLPAAGQQVRVATDSSLFDLTSEEYRARGVEYLIISSFTSEVRSIDPARDARRLAFYAGLDRAAEVVARFQPYAGGSAPPFVYDQIYAPFNSLNELDRPGPTITVYRFNAGPGTPP
jgi:dolichyl-phosphate-mannose-protein mannosyltransferase